MISFSLHRDSYPTILTAKVQTLLRAGERGEIPAAHYKALLKERFENVGRAPGYSSGDVWQEIDGSRTLVETFVTDIKAFILDVAP